jgi:hypothetical protein
MSATMTRRFLSTVLLTLSTLAALPAVAAADHVWLVNGQAAHWASTMNPAQIDLGDNLNDPVWDRQRFDPSLAWSASPLASGQLGASPFLRVNTQAGGLASNEVEMYDGFYGQDGWIGQATLDSIDPEGHIRDATVQLNRSYSLSEREKHSAVVHEVGHTLGLSHQEGTVMCPFLCGIDDPVAHDYEVLALVNSHTDSYDTPALRLEAPAEVGETTARRDGPRAVVFVSRVADRAVRVVIRDFVTTEAASAALRG